MAILRIVLFADSHLGIDQPANPRVQRRRRGDDFQANYQHVLDYAQQIQCDAVIHGGDVFHRSTVRPEIVQAAFVPLKALANTGVRVFVVPGNHERSKIPHSMLAVHPGVHIFDRPRTYSVKITGLTVALSGFPYTRSVRHCFRTLLEQTDWRKVSADVRILCVHHCFEGATVGPGNFTFRTADDVIRHADVPSDFAAVLTGHVHRHQVIRKNLNSHEVATSVIYPGSIERTSFAEKDEPKGFVELAIDTQTRGPAGLRWTFKPLPSRPMVHETIHTKLAPAAFHARLSQIVRTAPPSAIIRLTVAGFISRAHSQFLSAANTRRLAGPNRSLEIRVPSARNLHNRNGVDRNSGGHLTLGI